MRPLKISFLVFIFQITLSAQEKEILFNTLGENRTVQIADSFETVIEVKCYDERSDIGINFMLIYTIRNFSDVDIIWEISKSEIYSRDKNFKPVGYQIITNMDNVENSLPGITNIDTLIDIEVKSKSSLSILILFSKWQETDKYEVLLDHADADILVGTANLTNKRQENFIFRMIYFKEAN